MRPDGSPQPGPRQPPPDRPDSDQPAPPRDYPGPGFPAPEGGRPQNGGYGQDSGYQPYAGYGPGYGPVYGDGKDPRRSRRLAVRIAFGLGLVGFVVSAVGLVIQILPRHFSAAQQRQIVSWEVGRRWQTLPAGKIFPASVSYQLPATVLEDTSPLSLEALRVSIAPQQSNCTKAVTTAAAGAVLHRYGCQAVLRATYVDATHSYVATVGVAVMPSDAAATSANSGIDKPRLAAARNLQGGDQPAAGVGVISFSGSSAELYDYNRQISGSFTDGPYVVMYAAGYSDNRPRVPVSQDGYSDSEMTSVASGVAQAVAARLAIPPAAPHCPGAPGC